MFDDFRFFGGFFFLVQCLSGLALARDDSRLHSRRSGCWAVCATVAPGPGSPRRIMTAVFLEDDGDTARMATTLWPLTLSPTSRRPIWTALTPDPTANSRLDYIIGLSTSTAFPRPSLLPAPLLSLSKRIPRRILPTPAFTSSASERSRGRLLRCRCSMRIIPGCSNSLRLFDPLTILDVPLEQG
ncbi:hypothetical protein BDZ89DRAFT_1080439 [Hymenopellis radicata]|nr:hypothetical protein BDZ89DRAFT_1080439 [Hymenopellis radicata]